MTASFIASSINNGNNNIKPYDTFKQIITSQFISLIGNLVIVLPVCFIIAWISNYFYGNSVFDLQETMSPQKFIELLMQKNIRATAFGKQSVRFVTHRDVSRDEIDYVCEVLESDVFN